MKRVLMAVGLSVCKRLHWGQWWSWLLILHRVAYNRLQQHGAGTNGEFVTVPNNLKGYVIGKDGCTIKEIMKSSGAKISSPRRQDDGFLVKGDAGQRECAKRLILEKVVSAMCNDSIVRILFLCQMDWVDHFLLLRTYKLSMIYQITRSVQV